MNTLVQEDKIKFPSAISLFAANHEFMVIVYESDQSAVVIRHIYDQSFPDAATKYPHRIVSVHISSSNHLVIVTEINQVDIVFLSLAGSIAITNIKAFQKKGLVDIVAGDNVVGMLLGEKKLHLLELKENSCVSNEKYDLGGTPVKATCISEHLYVLFSDNTIKRWSKSVAGKYEPHSKPISLKEPMADLKAMRNNNRDYLVCLSQEKEVSLLSEDGKVVDVPSYEGEFRKIIVSHGLLAVVSKVKESEVFTLYHAQDNYSPDSSRLFFNKSEVYSRNANYRDCHLVPIAKKEWSAYSRRKGSKELKLVSEISEDVLCLVYGRLENDPSKLELLKIDASKLLNKDRDLNHISRYKRQGSAEEPSIKPSFSQHEINHPDQNEGARKSQKQIEKEPHKPPVTVIKKMELSDSCLRAVEKIVEERITPLIDRIGNLERKISSIEARISSLNTEEELTKLYSASLQKEVYTLFETKIVPKMDVYFQQIFSDLAQVFNQGIDYYSQKLLFETDLQKSTFKSLIAHTLNVTKEIVEATKIDMPERIKIESLLHSCVQKKDELLRRAEELLDKVEKGPFSYKSSGDKEIKEEEKREYRRQEKREEKTAEREEKANLKSDEKRKKFVKANIE